MLDELVERDELPGMTRRDRKKQETRWRIYSAGIELFSNHGYDNVTIEQICDKADVSSALFFHHFSSKSALIYLLLDRLKIRIGKALAEASDASSAKKLRLISAEIERSTAATAAFTPQLLSVLTASDTQIDMGRLDDGITGALADIVREGQKSGEFKKGWSPEIITVMLMSSWLLMPLARNSDAFPEQAHEELLKFIFAGLDERRTRPAQTETGDET